MHIRPSRKRLLAEIFTLFAFAAPAFAATITVNTAADEFDTPSGSDVSLREALRDAEALAGADTVNFAPALSGQTLTLTGGALGVTDADGVTVDATALGGGLTLKPVSGSRIFVVNGTLTVKGLTLTGASIDGNFGGGAIYNAGLLTLDRCTLSGNTSGYGGAIYNDGAAILTRCALAGNHALTDSGAIYNNNVLSLTNCTVAGNQADSQTGAIGNYGGTLSLNHATVAGNHDPSNDLGIDSDGTVNLANSIVAGNSSGVGADLASSGLLNIEGVNLVPVLADSGADGGSGTISPLDPGLAPLNCYGGATLSMPPVAASSPAVDAAAGSVLTVDQRGAPRPVDGNGDSTAVSDIGAVEREPGLFDAARLQVVNTADCGAGSLRHAIATAALLSGPDTVTFAPALSGQTITLTGGALAVNDAAGLTVDGSALTAGITMSGNNADRLFLNSGVLALRALTLTGGFTPPGNGGGAIYNTAQLTLDRCTVTGNSAGYGAALFTENTATSTLTQSTFAGNTAVTQGGAIYNRGTTLLQHATVSGNSAASQGGIYNFTGYSLTLENSIVSGNSGAGGADIGNDGALTRTGASLVADLVNAGTVTGSGTLIAASPQLGSLAANGGPTRTMLPLTGSRAINAAVGSSVITDQRGLYVNGVPDIGAAESAGLSPAGNFVTTTADSGAGSLRQLLADAATNPGPDLIRFAPALSGQTIALSGPLTSNDTAGVTVDGSTLSAGVILQGNGTDRVAFNSGILTLRALTLTGGWLDDCCGGAAIYNSGTLSLERSTVTGNYAGYGAALFTETGATSTVTQCTLSGNSAGVQGGAIYNRGTTLLDQTTVSGNSAVSQGGGIYNAGGYSLTLSNSLVGGNSGGSGADIGNDGTLIRVGASVVTDLRQAGTLGGSGTIIAAAPLLAPPGDYGGLTRTLALLPGSPARNAAVGSTVTSDQRGFEIFGTPDIGACEAGAQGNYNAWIWERLPAGSTAIQHAPAFDYDGDGRSNQLEWLESSDPASAGATLSLKAVRAGSNINITLFQMQPERFYTLEQNGSAGTANWINAPGVTALDGNLPGTMFTVPVPAGGMFYRVSAGF